MCPPNNGNGQPGFNEEDNEFLTLDLASICDVPLFNSLLHCGPELSTTNDTNWQSFEEQHHVETNSLCSSSIKDDQVDQKPQIDGITNYRNTKIIDDLPNMGHQTDKLPAVEFISDEYCQQQQQCSKLFVLGQRNILGDVLYQHVKKEGEYQSGEQETVETGGEGEIVNCTNNPLKGNKSSFMKIEIPSTPNQGKISCARMISGLNDSKYEVSHHPDTDDDSDGMGCKRRKLECKVCGDQASGYHYRVASCEACKAFFKRTVQGHIEYACPADGNCKISTRGRKACQACRFEKCIKVGMLKEGVRTDRKRGGRQKYFRRAIIDKTALVPQHGGMSLENSALMSSLKRCNLDTPLLAISLLRVETMTPPQIWTVLADLFNRYLKHIVANLNEIDGFAHFSLENKMNLLRGSWCEVLTLIFIYNSTLDDEWGLKFAPNFTLSSSKAHECGMEDFFNLCRKISERITGFGGMRYEELLLLKALILINADVTVDQRDHQRGLKDNLLSLLTNSATSLPTTPGSCAILHTQNLLLLLPCIREADILMRGMWKELKGQIDPRNQLLTEMVNH